MNITSIRHDDVHVSSHHHCHHSTTNSFPSTDANDATTSKNAYDGVPHDVYACGVHDAIRSPNQRTRAQTQMIQGHRVLYYYHVRRNGRQCVSSPDSRAYCPLLRRRLCLKVRDWLCARQTCLRRRRGGRLPDRARRILRGRWCRERIGVLCAGRCCRECCYPVDAD